MKRSREEGGEQRMRPRIRNLSKRANIDFDAAPFASGAFRNVYSGTYTGDGPQKGEPCVGKRFRSGCVFESVFFEQDIKAVGRCKSIVTAFNKAAIVNKTIFLNEPTVYEAAVPGADGRKELCLVEARAAIIPPSPTRARAFPPVHARRSSPQPLIEGDYTKFNSNTGHTNGSDVMQALSHFSYHYTHGQELMCDLQGGRYPDCYVLTDPVVMSRTGEYGATDLGAKGISNFFYHHKCNKFCRPEWRKEQAPKHAYKPVAGTTMAHGGMPMGSMGSMCLPPPPLPNAKRAVPPPVPWMPPVQPQYSYDAGWHDGDSWAYYKP